MAVTTNRLAGEKSPYLLQHAHNPVDWYPWGEGAFEKARAENKPIFLSVGYSTCHWCHVMEHESFENDEVAAVLNKYFVSIKVDREERPDIDRVYMTFVQATTGSGGWPMSVWLTPDLKPFFGGTYFPPSSRWGRPGFVELLEEIARVWASERDKIVESAEQVTRQLQQAAETLAEREMPGEPELDNALRQCRMSFDPRHGGFGQAPKFPRPAELLLLFREFARASHNPEGRFEEARDMALRTLQAMARGGMRDHIGGGFHRYAVDAAWRVPHFEKMLYDQAQLVMVYVEAAQITGDDFYAEVARDTLEYVLRDMRHPGGGFYSAEDADSVPPEAASAGEAPAGPHPKKSEGAFYIWTQAETESLLGPDAPAFDARFGVSREGNAPSDPQGEFVGKNLLYVARSLDEAAAPSGRSPDEIAAVLARARRVLFEARARRPRPHLDDKVLTAWNGLMISAFARASQVFDEPRYRDAARLAADFIRTRLWDDRSATLLRRFREDEAAIPAYADDYAFLIQGLLDLFEAGHEPNLLGWAIRLQARQDELFWDEQGAAWFNTTGHDRSVLLRMKEEYDGAEPSASSVSVLNLLRLEHLAPGTRSRTMPGAGEQADRTLRFFGHRLRALPQAVPMMLVALSARLAGFQQIVLVGQRDAPDLRALLGEVHRCFLPHKLVIVAEPGEHQQRLGRIIPFIAHMRPLNQRATAYVCRDFTCRPPVTDVGALRAELA